MPVGSYKFPFRRSSVRYFFLTHSSETPFVTLLLNFGCFRVVQKSARISFLGTLPSCHSGPFGTYLNVSSLLLAEMFPRCAPHNYKLQSAIRFAGNNNFLSKFGKKAQPFRSLLQYLINRRVPFTDFVAAC